MDDIKLMQNCQVVLVDCFKGFGPASGYDAEDQSWTQSVAAKLPTNGQCASNSNRFKRHSLIFSSKGSETSNCKIDNTNQSQVVLKSIYKNSNGLKKIRTTRSYERVPPAMIPQHHENYRPAKLDEIKQPKSKTSYGKINTCDSVVCLADTKNSMLPTISTNNLGLDPKGGQPHESASSDNLILDPKSGKLYKSVSSSNETSTEDLILNPKENKLCNPAGSADELVLDPKEGTLFTNPLCSMPSVGLTVNAGIGQPLPSLSAKCVLTCLDECKNLISSEYAEFCSAVVKTSPLPKNKTLILPIKDDRILQLMQIKWNSRSTVKQVSLSASLNSPILTPNHSIQSKSDCEFSSSVSLNAPTLTANLTAESGNNSLTNHNCEKKQSEGKQTAPNPIIKRKYARKKWPVRDLSKSIDSNSGSEWGSSSKRTRLSLLNDDKKKVSSLETGVSNQDISAMNSSSVDSGSQFHTKTLANPIDSDDDEMRTVTKKTAFEILEAPYDPDDVRVINQSEEKVVKCSEITRGKASSHVLHELRRLNVAVFDMPTSSESVVCGTPDICRLGCVCSSLFSRVVRDNCGLEKCMFGCICRKTQSFNRGNQSYTWVQNKAKENLAKEERFFKQTVVRSGKDDLILVEGKRKRERKMPKKYSDDFLSFLDVKQSKTSKDWLYPDEEIPYEVGCDTKKAKRVKLPPNVLRTKAPTLTGEENSPNTSTVKELTSEPSNSCLFDSARTAFYDYKSSNLFHYNQLKSDESIEKIDSGSELFKIASIQSLDQNDWEDLDINNTPDSVALPSCSYLFDAEYVKNSTGKVNILNWDALYNDIVSETAFVWYQPSLPKPKVYLTKSPTAPCYDCLNFHRIDVGSDAFKSLPNYLKALKTGWLPTATVREVGWVVKFVRSFWMIVGYIRHGSFEQAENAEQTCNSGEIDVLPSIDEDYPSRWWVMDLSQNFDLIYFMDFSKALTKRQMETLLRLSNEYSESDNKVHRILLNRQRPKLNSALKSCPDFGAYSISNHANKIFIGPYHSFNEPKFQVYSQKAAPNGKTQYLCVPLFYCGNEECVRVTSQGVLSLHSESLPDDYVQGFWYQSCGNNLRESSEKPQLAGTSGNQEPVSLSQVKQRGIPEILPISDDEGSEVHDIHNIVTNKKIEKKSTDRGSFRDLTAAKEDEGSSSDISVGDHINDKLPEDTSASILQNVASSESVVSSQDESDDDDDESDIQSDIEEGKPRLVYMIPSDSNIGYVTLTYLPGGAISVPHFTETASLKFYHHRLEVVKELNRLIHRKLSCLSRKCSVFLKDDDVCTCVHWSFTKKNPNCESMPKFTPQIFNGFFMLTNYGLLDLRSAEDSIVQKLGKDWVDWMKNDQIRLKLQHWKSKEEQEVLEEKLKTILSTNKDLPLLEVLSKATDEIAKLKAEDQLLDYESQSQKMLKETLISSLCSKLEGIPVDVAPKFLEHLELSLLWEVLECMNNRKTILISVSKPANGKTNVKERCGKKCARLKTVNSKLVPKAAPNSQTSSPRRRALQYMERLREEIRQEEKKKLKTEGGTSQQKLQVPAKTWEKLQDSPSSSSTNDGLSLKEGLACRMSQFSRINVCVEEGGIKHLPVMSPPLMKSPKGSPEKPNILRKSKPGAVGVTSPVSHQAQKQARKQVFQSKWEEPLYLENPVTNMPDSFATPVISGIDPISSLCIASVVSQGNSVTASSQKPYEVNPSESSSTLCEGPVQTSAANCVDPVSSLRIANVFSTRDVPKTLSQTNNFSPHLDPDPVSSLRISSVTSGAFSSISSVQVSSVSTPCSLSTSMATVALSTPLLKANGLMPSISSAQSCGPVISRSMAGPSQNAGQTTSKPATTSSNNVIVGSKNKEKLVKGIVQNTFKLHPGVCSKLRAVHVMKDNGFITIHTNVPTSNVWNHSLLNTAPKSLPFIKNQGESASK